MGVGVIVGVSVGSGSVVAWILGIEIFCPTAMVVTSVMLLACCIACTDVPYFRAMRYKFSPSCTVWMIDMPVDEPPLATVGRAAIRVAAGVVGTTDRVVLAPAAAPELAQPPNTKSAISNPIALSPCHRFITCSLGDLSIVCAIVIQN
jgi:hypothetical protein